MTSLFCFALLCVLSSFVIISLGKRKLIALLLLCSVGHVTVIVLDLFLTVPWVGLWYVIVAFLGQTQLLFFLQPYLKYSIAFIKLAKIYTVIFHRICFNKLEM